MTLACKEITSIPGPFEINLYRVSRESIHRTLPFSSPWVAHLQLVIQNFEFIGSDWLNWFEHDIELLELIIELIELNIRLIGWINLIIGLIESIIRLIESIIGLIESIIGLIESIIGLIESIIGLIELIVGLIELIIELIRTWCWNNWIDLNLMLK
jgi:phage-related protein